MKERNLSLIIIAMFVFACTMAGCGGEQNDNDNPEGGHTVQITNWLDLGQDFGGETNIDIYIDGAVRKRNLSYGSTAAITGISGGSHTILVSASSGQGTLFDVSTTLTASGYGGSIAIWVDDDGLHQVQG